MSVTVPSADVGAITDGNYTISAAVSDKAGNPASAALHRRLGFAEVASDRPGVLVFQREL